MPLEKIGEALAVIGATLPQPANKMLETMRRFTYSLLPNCVLMFCPDALWIREKYVGASEFSCLRFAKQ